MIMSENEFDREKILKEISEAWKETEEYFGIKRDVNAKIKIPGWKDINIKIKIKSEKKK